MFFVIIDKFNSICTFDTEVVTIYKKLGYKFNLKISQKLTIENIIFDMIEEIVPWKNDPSSVLTKLVNACQYNNSTKIIVNNVNTESWSLRTTLTDSCARSQSITCLHLWIITPAYLNLFNL